MEGEGFRMFRWSIESGVGCRVLSVGRRVLGAGFRV